MSSFLTYGELLIRLSATESYRMQIADRYDLYVGGAEGNVAMALAQWGFESKMISAVPDNSLGEKVVRTLKTYGVDTGYIDQQGEKIGVYFTEEGSGVKPADVVYDRSDSVFSKSGIGDQLRNLPVNEKWFHWTGITPAVSEMTYTNLRSILEKYQGGKCIISADLNYRSKLWQWGVKPESVIPQLVEWSDVLITTEESVEKMLGNKVKKAPEEISPSFYAELGESLMKQFKNLKYVLIPVRRTISARNNLITLFGQERSKEMIQSPVFEITEMVDRIGAGDAMAAGLIRGISKGAKLEDTLSFAVAASAYKHAIVGDTIVASEKDIMEIAKGQKAKISR